MDKTIIMDGAMGTYLREKGIGYKEILKVNLTNPKIIKNVHEEYIKAGARIISTNTFTSLSLLESGEYKKFELIIDSALKISKMARNNFENKDIKIALDFGPLANINEENLIEIYKKAYSLILNKEFDYLILETQYDLKQTLIALEEFKEINKPIIVSFTFNEEDKLYSGERVKQILEEINERNIKNLFAIGANCSCGPNNMLKLVDEFRKHSKLPIVIKPNLGIPTNINGELRYNCSLEKFKNEMYKIKEKGVTFLGGCCGTTPQYIKAISSL